MARVLYGVHGTGHGHAMRAVALARRFPEHEFLFVSHSHGLEALSPEFEVVECYNPETPIQGHQVQAFSAFWSMVRAQSRRRSLMGRVLDTIERFQPQAALTDYEFFVPRAARKVGLPCLSVDHQHVVTCCRHQLPFSQYPSFAATAAAIGGFFSTAPENLIISFYQPPVKPGVRAVVAPPLLRETVLGCRPEVGEHVLAYHGYPIFSYFYDFLRSIPKTVIIYGSDEDRRDGNLVYKKKSEEGFLEDLAAANYVICGGGHTLISEALYLGKPVLVFPIKGAFEQFLNAHYVDRLGYGLYHLGFQPQADLIPEFENRLESFRANIRAVNFCGNQDILSRIDHFINHGTLG